MTVITASLSLCRVSTLGLLPGSHRGMLMTLRIYIWNMQERLLMWCCVVVQAPCRCPGSAPWPAGSAPCSSASAERCCRGSCWLSRPSPRCPTAPASCSPPSSGKALGLELYRRFPHTVLFPALSNFKKKFKHYLP